jgi:outer membrane protein W
MKHVIQKTILLSAACFSLGCASYAQKSYFSFGAGYGFKAGSQNFANFNNADIGNNSITYEQINLSLGRGLNAGASFGYFFNDNVGLDLGVNYLLGSKTMATDDYVGGKTEITYSGNMIRLNPSLILRAKSGKLNPYVHFGFIAGVGSIHSGFKDIDMGDVMLIKIKLNGGIALGLSSAVGVDYKLNDKVALFGEINAVNMSYAPSYGKAIEASYNGVDALPDMTTSDKEFEFLNSYTETTATPPDSQPTKALKQKYPFSSVGLNLGLRIAL